MPKKPFELSTVDHFRLDCERFMERHGIKTTEFSIKFAYTPNFMARLRRGMNCTGKIMDRVRVNMEEYAAEARKVSRPRTKRRRVKKEQAA